MANFRPLKNYILYCLEHLCAAYPLEGPFLDAGCGQGDVSEYLAQKGFKGKAIDVSEQAFAAARRRFEQSNLVVVEQKDLFSESGAYSLVLLFDVLEHIEDDAAVLQKVCSLLNPSGHLVLTLPSNPREWRWDDDYYGHVRRYTPEEIGRKLESSGLEPIAAWDFTFPVFWLMRRLYTRFRSNPLRQDQDNAQKTRMSACRNAWDMPLSTTLSKDSFLWRMVYAISFKYFRQKVHRGHEMIILARKRNL
ncbi:MAG: class I SAM-dependent methyltransferase [Planctomycetaceae bacterium]|nr:class I SAM-dependent methyltransferase [Planctomycetaceae bacterium]